MLKVGITGGIGSGKSLVAKLFQMLGVPVYFADEAAKNIMNTDAGLRQKIIEHFGEATYTGNTLNRPALASQVFNQPDKLQLLNSLVHPVVIQQGKNWIAAQLHPLVMKEAAIFFESGSYSDMDLMIGVFAPKEMRLQRAMLRDGASQADVETRMSRQMDEDEKMKRCDFVITNDENSLLIPQVLKLHASLMEKATTA